MFSVPALRMLPLVRPSTFAVPPPLTVVLTAIPPLSTSITSPLLSVIPLLVWPEGTVCVVMTVPLLLLFLLQCDIGTA